jgi:hypothetical protein
VPAERLAQFRNPQVLLNLFGAIKVGLVAALHDVFLLGPILMVFGVVAVLFMKELPLRTGRTASE